MRTLNFISSSNIRQMEWSDGTLKIKFVGGKVYEYEDVPESVMDEAADALSVGKYFNDNIRGKYKATQI